VSHAPQIALAYSVVWSIRFIIIAYKFSNSHATFLSQPLIAFKEPNLELSQNCVICTWPSSRSLYGLFDQRYADSVINSVTQTRLTLIHWSILIYPLTTYTLALGQCNQPKGSIEVLICSVHRVLQLYGIKVWN
jgi:hypothetical protein